MRLSSYLAAVHALQASFGRADDVDTSRQTLERGDSGEHLLALKVIHIERLTIHHNASDGSTHLHDVGELAPALGGTVCIHTTCRHIKNGVLLIHTIEHRRGSAGSRTRWIAQIYRCCGKNIDGLQVYTSCKGVLTDRDNGSGNRYLRQTRLFSKAPSAMATTWNSTPS